jgi:hypothetical protein
MIFLFVYLSDQAINLLNILLRTTNTTTTLQPRILDDLNYISSGHILCESPFESRFGTYAAAADVDVTTTTTNTTKNYARSINSR